MSDMYKKSRFNAVYSWLLRQGYYSYKNNSICSADVLMLHI